MVKKGHFRSFSNPKNDSFSKTKHFHILSLSNSKFSRKKQQKKIQKSMPLGFIAGGTLNKPNNI